MVAAFVATAFAQEDAEAASTQWRQVADQLRPKAPKLASLMDEAEPDVLAYMTFPREHRTKLHSTNPLERLNGEIKRRTNVRIFPNEAATPLIGAILLEQNDEWSRGHATLAPIPGSGRASSHDSACSPWERASSRPRGEEDRGQIGGPDLAGRLEGRVARLAQIVP